MKKLFTYLAAVLLCGAVAAQNMPKHLYVAGQADGGKTKVYNCNTKEVKYVNGHLRNIGVDNNGNIYILVCSDVKGWGNYYVYRNFDEKKAGQVLECGAVIQNGKKLYSWGGSVDNSFDLVAVYNGFYKLTRLPNKDLIIHYQKKYVFDGRYYRYLESDDITVPAGTIDGREPMLAVAE